MPQEPWTPLTIIKTTADYLAGRGVEEPRLDAELLLSNVLGIDRIGLYTGFERVLTGRELDHYRELVRQRAAGRPCKYITGRTEFYSIELAVDERSLIPRPESEHVVERALDVLGGRREEDFALVVELGTGSGAIIIAVAANAADAGFVATDVSADALELARSNAAAAGVAGKIEFVRGDLFDPLVVMGLECRVDMLVSNPPYLSEKQWECLPRSITGYEPREALVAGPNGTEVEERILEGARLFLRPGGVIIMEIDPSQRDYLMTAASSFCEYGQVRFFADYARRPRVMEVEKKK